MIDSGKLIHFKAENNFDWLESIAINIIRSIQLVISRDFYISPFFVVDDNLVRFWLFLNEHFRIRFAK